MTAARRARLFALAAGVALLSTPGVRGAAHAELLEVRQVAAGMECPECARALQLRVKQLPGIDGIATSWNRRILSARLRPGNRTTLAQIRALVLAQHFQAREAEIVVAGQLATADSGAFALRVPESGVIYHIDLRGLTGPARDRWQSRLAAAAAVDANVVVTGRVPGAPGGVDPQILWPILLEDGAPRS